MRVSFPLLLLLLCALHATALPVPDPCFVKDFFFKPSSTTSPNTKNPAPSSSVTNPPNDSGSHTPHSSGSQSPGPSQYHTPQGSGSQTPHSLTSLRYDPPPYGGAAPPNYNSIYGSETASLHHSEPHTPNNLNVAGRQMTGFGSQSFPHVGHQDMTLPGASDYLNDLMSGQHFQLTANEVGNRVRPLFDNLQPPAEKGWGKYNPLKWFTAKPDRFPLPTMGQ